MRGSHEEGLRSSGDSGDWRWWLVESWCLVGILATGDSRRVDHGIPLPNMNVSMLFALSLASMDEELIIVK